MSSKPTQNFTSKTLNWMRRWRSQGHLVSRSGTYPASEQEWSTLLEGITEEIHRDEFTFDRMHTAPIKGNVVLTTRYLEEVLVLRKINDNIRRAYGVRQPNRQRLVKTAIQALNENVPKTVVRVDLRKCFESINRTEVLKTIVSDGNVTFQTVALLNSLFEFSSQLSPKLNTKGLPRGVIISSTLAEIKLLDLDRRIRRIPGVYLLLRYVDDLLVFSTSSELKALTDVTSAIESAGLRPNPIKTKPVRIACGCEESCTHGQACPCKKACKCAEQNPELEHVEYLGYKLFFLPHNGKQANQIYCALSDRKVAKIKSRIHLAISSYTNSGDHKLLELRMKYLTANQAVHQSLNRRAMFSGLAYTHALYDPPPNGAAKGNLIADLDQFYRAGLRRLAKTRKPPNEDHLLKLSFQSGFDHKRRTKFSAAEMNRIRECWQNA